jgi:septum formation protein
MTTTPAAVPVVLASASPARRRLLQAAGITPVVIVSDVDEKALLAAKPDRPPHESALVLARAKCEAVADLHAARVPEGTVFIGCDSIFEVDGVGYGKPASAEQARERWAGMMGQVGTLHTGHWIIRRGLGCGSTASTRVRMGRLSPREMDAYLATGEPLAVAGGFTLDGLGGAFVDGVDGDPSNVIGLSLPTFRRLLAEIGVTWTDLWGTAPRDCA